MGGLGLWVGSEWRRTWRTLVGLSLLLALGGGLTIAAVAGARRADTAFDRFTRATGATLTVGASPEAIEQVDVFALGEELAAIPGVGGVSPLAWIGAGLDAPGLRDALFSAATAPAAGANPPSIVAMVEGRPVDPAAVDEVMINPEAARISGLSVGDRVTVRTLSPDQFVEFVTEGNADEPLGPTTTVDVVGIYRTVQDITDQPDPFAFFPAGFLERYGDEVATCECNLFVNATPEARPAVESIAASTGTSGSLVVESADAAAIDRISQAVAVETNTLWIAAAVAGLAGLVVIGQAFDRHLSERRSGWTSLAAIGAVRPQLIRSWLIVQLPFLALGSLLAGALALALSPLFPRGVARSAEPDPGIRIDVAALSIGVVVVGTLATALVVLVAWLRSSRPARRARRPLIVSWLTGAPAPVAMGAGFAIDPTRDRRGSTAFSAVIGLALAIACVVAVALIDRSVTDLLDTPNAYGADWNLQMTQQPDDVDEAVRQTLADPAVDALATVWQAGGVAFVVSSTDGDTASEYPVAMENIAGSMGARLTEGHLAGEPGEVVLGTATADALDVGSGDEVVVTSRRGDEVVYRVTGTGRLADDEDSDRFALMTTDGLARLQSEGQPLELSGAYVRTSSTDPEMMTGLHAMGWTDFVPPAKANNLRQIGDVPILLSIALFALGIGAAANTLLVALRRRRDDLAITRAMGFTTRQSAATMRWQGMTTALLAILLGVPVGVIGGRTIWRLLADGAGVTDLATIPWMAIVVTPTVMFLTVVAMAALVGRRAAHLVPAKVLRSE